MIEFGEFDETVSYVKTATEYNNDAIMWIYSYRIEDVMFDAGCASAKDEMTQYLSENPIKRLYISHSHEDHCGNAALFESKAEIYAHPAAKEILLHPPEYNEFFAWVWGQPDPLNSVQDMPNEFSIGELQFKVIELFGHAYDMVGFYEPEKKWLFSADAVPVPSRKSMAMPEENIPQQIATMEKILSLKIEVLFDSHRGPIKSPQDYIAKRVEYLKDLQTRIKSLDNDGLTVEEIQKELEIEGPWYMDLTGERFRIDHLIKSLLNDTVDDE
jgi:glyoxylase-like metal-dependent hydrolase (beta-lactamase superfamily II)